MSPSCVRIAAAVLALLPALAAAGWSVVQGRDPLHTDRRCLLVADPVTVSDGYTDTRIEFVIDGEALVLVTQSELDPSFGDLTLTIDRKPPVAFARIERKMLLVFSPLPPLLELLKAGGTATFSLRFWPTWPSMGLVPVAVSLKGFTRAAEELERCNARGA